MMEETRQMPKWFATSDFHKEFLKSKDPRRVLMMEETRQMPKWFATSDFHKEFLKRGKQKLTAKTPRREEN